MPNVRKQWYMIEVDPYGNNAKVWDSCVGDEHAKLHGQGPLDSIRPDNRETSSGWRIWLRARDTTEARSDAKEWVQNRKAG